MKHFNGCQNNGYYLALIKDDNTGIPADTCNQCTPVRKSVHPKRNSFFYENRFLCKKAKRNIFVWFEKRITTALSLSNHLHRFIYRCQLYICLKLWIKFQLSREVVCTISKSALFFHQKSKNKQSKKILNSTYFLLTFRLISAVRILKKNILAGVHVFFEKLRIFPVHSSGAFKFSELAFTFKWFELKKYKKT